MNSVIKQSLLFYLLILLYSVINTEVEVKESEVDVKVDRKQVREFHKELALYQINRR